MVSDEAYSLHVSDASVLMRLAAIPASQRGFDGKSGMIICHCTRTTDHEIREAIAWMRAADPHVIITRGKIYKVLGRRPDCGDCMSLFMSTMESSADFGVPKILANLRASLGKAPKVDQG